MNLFLKKILLFSGLLFLLNCGLKVLLNKLYFNDYNEVVLDAQTYLLSDSHGAYIGEFTNDSIYNFSSPSDSYLDMEIKLEYLIKESNIKKVLLSVDRYTLSPYRGSLNNADRSVYYSSREDFSGFPEYIWNKYIEYNFVIVNPKYGPIIKNYLKSFIAGNSVKGEKNWIDVPMEERKELSVKRYNEQFAFENFSIELLYSLKRIVSLCKSNGIDIVGIKFPLSREYREVIGSKNFNADSVLINNDFEIYDFNIAEFSDPRYFKNQDHLNTDGAQRFKKMILDSLSN